MRGIQLLCSNVFCFCNCDNKALGLKAHGYCSVFRAICHTKLTEKTWFLRNEVEIIQTDGENRKRIVLLFLCMLKNWKLWLNCSKSQRWRKTWESAIRDLSGLVCMCLRIYVCREQSKEATSLASRRTVWLSTGKQKWGYERSHSHPFSNTRALDLTVINGCHCHAWWYRAHIKKVREGESALSPDEDASSLVSKCNVLSQVSHLLPIMSGIQAATRLHIAAKTPQTSMAGNVKPSIIYYPWRAECCKGDKQFFFFFFFFRDTTAAGCFLVDVLWLAFTLYSRRRRFPWLKTLGPLIQA